MTEPDWAYEDEALGFTGSRQGMTKTQKKWLYDRVYFEVMDAFPKVKRAHHGCCVGSDLIFHNITKTTLDVGLQRIILHPPSKHEYEMTYSPWDMEHCLWFPRKGYLERDRDIVSRCSRMLATPNNFKPTRGSGTWYTIQQAIDSSRNLWVCFPNGEYRHTVAGQTVEEGLYAA